MLPFVWKYLSVDRGPWMYRGLTWIWHNFPIIFQRKKDRVRQRDREIGGREGRDWVTGIDRQIERLRETETICLSLSICLSVCLNLSLSLSLFLSLYPLFICLSLSLSLKLWGKFCLIDVRPEKSAVWDRPEHNCCFWRVFWDLRCFRDFNFFKLLDDWCYHGQSKTVLGLKD